jgi:YgiT-type zinc finger domain-containing protein
MSQCQICGGETAEWVEEDTTISVRGVNVFIPNYKWLKCSVCDDGVVDRETVKRFEDVVRKSGLLERKLKMDYAVVNRGKEFLKNIENGFANWTTDLRSAMTINDRQTADDYAVMFEGTVETFERWC